MFCSRTVCEIVGLLCRREQRSPWRHEPAIESCSVQRAESEWCSASSRERGNTTHDTRHTTHNPPQTRHRTYFEVERAVDSVLFSPENLRQVVRHDDALGVFRERCGNPTVVSTARSADLACLQLQTRIQYSNTNGKYRRRKEKYNKGRFKDIGDTLCPTQRVE